MARKRTTRPPGQPHIGLLDSIREKLWIYTVSLFRLDLGLPVHSGTATCLTMNGHFYLLTARHAWEVIRASDFAVALEGDRLLIPIESEAACGSPEYVSGTAEWGPDLTLIRLPIQIAKEIQQVKAFYNFARRRPAPKAPPGWARKSLWAVLGAPDEQSIKGEHETMHRLSLFETWTAQSRRKAGWDYVDLEFCRKRRPALPRSFAGISGSGLWEMPVLLRRGRAEIAWRETARLAGVAFYEVPGRAGAVSIRCHGPRSIRRLVERGA